MKTLKPTRSSAAHSLSLSLAILTVFLATGCLKPMAGSAVKAAATCSYPAWVAGTNYKAGDKVLYNTKPYVASSANPGYDPVISTYFWSPTTCDSAPAPTSGGSCQGEAWQQGKTYAEGAIVIYNAKAYKATHENPGYDPVISTYYWSLTDCSAAGSTTGSQNPNQTPNQPSTPTKDPANSGSGFRGIVSETMFNSMFPSRLPFYSYEGITKAIDGYSGFASTGDEATRKREVAAFLANIAHESVNLTAIEEINKANWPLYCMPSAATPCAAGKQYYGRGPIQISWNYNYAAAGKVLGKDLLNNPDLVAQDSSIAWGTAIWYWMTQTGPSSMTPHAAITGTAGFGETINGINGSLECKGGNAAQVASRVANYKKFLGIIGGTPGPGNNDGC